MVFFWRKQESVEKMLQSYFTRADECFVALERALAVLFEKGQGEDFERAVGAIHEVESSADDLRREIEYTLYGKELLPESRGDLLGLLESFDELPNMAETVGFVLRSQRVVLPSGMLDDFKHLVDINLHAYNLVRKAVDALFDNPRIVLTCTKDVDHKESESDRAERELIYKIFDGDFDAGTKMMFKEIVLLIGDISDRAEKVADRISIIAIKRQI